MRKHIPAVTAGIAVLATAGGGAPSRRTRRPSGVVFHVLSDAFCEGRAPTRR
jgi:hypothetical protein